MELIFNKSQLFNFFFCLSLVTLVLSEEVEDDSILDWEAPIELQRLYPYFVSGFDKDGSPINVFEFGRWDIRHTMEKGGKDVEDFSKYTEQMFKRFFESPRTYNTSTDDYVIIADLDGYDLRQATHLPTVAKMGELAKHFVLANKGQPDHIKKVYMVNSNILFQTVYNTIKPILGELSQYIVSYGTVSEKWAPILLKTMPKDQLPDWLGGSKEKFRPFHIFGKK